MVIAEDILIHRTSRATMPGGVPSFQRIVIDLIVLTC
jgi:hypothetical protein